MSDLEHSNFENSNLENDLAGSESPRDLSAQLVREAKLMQFEEAWRLSGHPDIAEYLPPQQDAEYRPLLVELITIDLEHQLSRNSEFDLETYSPLLQVLDSDREIRSEIRSHEQAFRKQLEESQSRDNARDGVCAGALTSTMVSQDRTLRAGKSRPSLELVAGAMLNQYRIEKRIGYGAFSSVFSAEDTRLHRRVALKVLNSQVASPSEIRVRMLREAQAAACLQHENVVAVYETGRADQLDYIVSRLVEGDSLEERLDRTKLPLRMSVEIVSKIASALSTAHYHGIVHRDLKPANIMLEGDTPLIVDFGLAHLSDASLKLTMEGDVVGTPSYMAPEQAAGMGWQGDPRSDIYSLGAVLFRLACHQLPFRGTTPQVISQVLNKEPPTPRKINPEIDQDLQTIILKCLEKEPSSRYQTAEALQQDLECYLAGMSITARPSGITRRTLKWARRRPFIASLTLITLVLSAFSLGVVSQLMQVGRERDKARAAKQETEILLAAAAADAGLLSMAHGNFTEAIHHFEESMTRSPSPTASVRFGLMESHLGLRQLDQARQLFSGMTAPQRSGQHLLWEAELAFEGLASEDPVSLFRAALESEAGLSPADQHYVRGILAESSEEALQHFELAVQIDPYHHRAQRMRAIMQFSLAHFAELLDRLATVRQLFPHDLDFALLQSLALAGHGQLDDARAVVQSCDLSVEDQSKWLRFCEMVHNVAHDMPYDSGLAEFDAGKLASLAKNFDVEFKPLIAKRGWHFPPFIASHFDTLPNQIALLDAVDTSSALVVLQQLVDIHPEASLQNLLAGFYIAVSGEPDISNEDAIANLVKARDLFERTTRTPGFLNGSEDFAWKGLFATSVSLAISFNHEVDKHREIGADASTHVDPSDVAPRHVTIFGLVLLNFQKPELAQRWIEAWISLEGESGPQRTSAIWNLALCQRDQGDWLGALATIRQLLDLEPENQLALDLEASALKRLNQVVIDER